MYKCNKEIARCLNFFEFPHVLAA